MQGKSSPLPQLPHSPEAERAVLGAVLVVDAVPNPALKTAAEEIHSGDFFLPQHQRIFARMLELDANRQPIEFVTLIERLQAAGELDAVGGAPYLAQLADGIPKVSNVVHYARIVREKAVRRMVVHAGQQLSESALIPTASLEEISQQLQGLPKIVIPSLHTRGLTAVTAEAFLGMQLPEREMIVNPILATQSLALLYAPRGVGKTFFAAAIAHTVATGGSLFEWRAPKPRDVLFVDGELPAPVLRDRICVVAEAAQSKAGLERLQLITPDLQSAPMPDLATPAGQACIEACLDGVALVILDNLSALCRSGKENEGEGWLPVQEWALRLRQRGIAVLFVHHAGKGGAQRGTSRREDVLDLVLALRRPTDYSPSEGLRCELHFEKCRSLIGEAAKPFEVKLQADSTGTPVWAVRPIENALLSRAAELFKDGVSVRDAADELGISRSKAHRMKTKLERTADLE